MIGNGHAKDLLGLLQHLKTQRSSVEAEFQQKASKLDKKIEVAESALKLLQEELGVELPVEAHIRAAEFKGKTQLEVMEEIARKNDNRVKVNQAKTILTAIGRMKPSKNSWGAIYTALSRSPKFEKCGPGEFRLIQRFPRDRGPVSLNPAGFEEPE